MSELSSSKRRVVRKHPQISSMVKKAIKQLKERDGSSLQAIKKYISANYNFDTKKRAFFIRKYIKTAVASGALVRTRGTGAAGSFRLAGSDVVKPLTKSTSRPKSARKSSAAKKSPAARKSTRRVTKGAPKRKTRKRSAAKSTKARKTAKSPSRKRKTGRVAKKRAMRVRVNVRKSG